MELKIDPEFQSLIPPLSSEEHELFLRNGLGFDGVRTVNGLPETLRLIPTPMGEGWWIFSHRSLYDGEVFAKSPMAISRLPLNNWRGFAMTAVPMSPLWNYPEESKPKRRLLSPQIYFLEAVGSGFIKIGTASDVDFRVQLLQCGCPHELVIRASYEGGHKEESGLHELFRRHWVRGEWFTFHQDIGDAIALVNDGRAI